MRMRTRSLPVSILVFLFLICALVFATRSEAGSALQDPQNPPAGAPGGQEQQRPDRQPPSTEPRPYERVITKDAK